MSRYLMNHWRDTRYSTGVLQRSCTLTICCFFSMDFTAPAAFQSSMTCFLALYMCMPAYLPASSFNVPSLFLMCLIFNSGCFATNSTSDESPKGHQYTTPVPNSIFVKVSAIIGTTALLSGIVAVFPTNWLYLLSSGWTEIAMHAIINSGRVVAKTNGFPNDVLTSTLTKSACFSLSCNSACAIAVLHSGHQMVGASF